MEPVCGGVIAGLMSAADCCCFIVSSCLKKDFEGFIYGIEIILAGFMRFDLYLFVFGVVEEYRFIMLFLK